MYSHDSECILAFLVTAKDLALRMSQGTIDGIHLGNRLHWNSVIPWRQSTFEHDLIILI